MWGIGLSQKKPSESKKTLKKQSVTRMAGLMSLGTLMSRILGFVRDRLIVQFFDSSMTDIFYAAFRLPNFFRILLGEGALSVAFLPAYVELKKKQLGEKQLAGTVFSFLSILALVCSVLGVIFMPQILEMFLSSKNFPVGSERFLTTVFFARIMFFYLFLVSQFAFFMSLLNANEEFWYPGVAPAAFNAGVILTILCGSDVGGVTGSVLAVAVIVGGVLQFATVFFKAFRMRIVPCPNFLFLHPSFIAVLKRTTPSLVGIGAIQFIGVINVSLASSLQSADITFLYLADRLLELPQSILAVSLGAALLSRLSSLWADEDVEGFRKQLYETASVYYFLAIPAAIGLYILAEPLVSLLFKTGRNSFEDMKSIGLLVQVYAVLLLISGTSKLLLPGFYAVKKTLYPALSSVLTIIIHLTLAPQLMSKMGLQGLVLSTTLSSLAALIFTFVVFRFKVTALSPLQMFRSFPVLIILNIPTVALCLYGYSIWSEATSLLQKNFILITNVTLVVIFYFFIGYFFKVPYAMQFLRMFKSRRS